MKKFIILLAVLLAFFVGMNVGVYFYQPTYLKELAESYTPQFSGYKQVQVSINDTTVYLVGGCNAISFDVTTDQAFSITNGIRGITTSRPLTHDIMRDMLEVFGIEVLQIKIDRYDNDIYYATIILRNGNKILEQDARPSDAIALAFRTKTPIYFSEALLENGDYICQVRA